MSQNACKLKIVYPRGIVFISLMLVSISNYAQKQDSIRLKATVADQQVQLSWTCDSTATDHFIIEQGENGSLYNTVGMMRWSKGKTSYTYEYTCSKGINTFRIKRILTDKESDFSNTVTLHIGHKTSINAFPNPNMGRFTLSHPMASGTEQIQITDLQGTVLHQANLTRSSVHTLFNVAQLGKGNFYLVYQTEFEKISLKLFIQ